MSASAPLSTDMKFYYSGPTGGSDDNRINNRGGALATPLVEMTTGAKYNWFPDVSRVTMTWFNDGQYWNQYACFLIKNTSATFTMSAAVLSVNSTLIPTDAIVGLGVSLKNAVPVDIVNINTAPTGITFKEKVGGVLPSITLSDMKPAEYYAVWARLRQPHGKPLFKWAKMKFRVDWTNVPIVPPPPPPEQWTNFQDSTGPVLSPCKIFTIFHGGAWDTASNPSMDDINNSIQALCDGTYFSKLSQYRDIANPIYDDTYWAEGYDLQSTFSDSDMRSKLNSMIDNSDVPSPSDRELLYVCFPDQNASRNDGAISGNSAYTHGSNNVHYCWADTGVDKSTTMKRITKQLINAISNPEHSGTVGTPGIESKDGTHKSLADWCTGTGTSSGVSAAQYYSEENGACVVP